MGSTSTPLKDSHVRVGVGVFVAKSRIDKRFVLGLRRGSHGAGTHSLPGGHLEFGETFEQCAIRETLEETGLEIEAVEFLTATETMFHAEGKHYVTIYMTAFAKKGSDGEIPDPKVLEPEKCDYWTWRSIREIRAMNEESGGRLFEPIRNFLAHRPSACATLEEETLMVGSRPAFEA